MAALLLRANGTINPKVVGKTATYIAERAGISVNPSTKVLISEESDVAHTNPYSREKLCPVLGLYVADDWQAACDRVVELLTNEGIGHTLVIHTQNEDVIRQFSLEKPVYRILVNTPSALGGIGATTNLFPALTLGCGAMGGGSSSDNVGPMNLLNIRKVGYGVRTVAELRGHGECAASEPSSALLSSSCHQGRVSIVEDARFTASSSALHDTRFTPVTAPLAEAGSGEISEQSVERVIRQVLERLAT